MFIKVHHSYREVVAICDSNLIGKKFEEGKFQLDLKESFYKGEELNEEELKQKIKEQAIEDATFNIVGENSIRIAIEMKIIKPEGINKIAGIPYALVLM